MNLPMTIVGISVLFSLIFTSFDNIQEHLEHPFDQIGEDDMRINAKKFEKTLDVYGLYCLLKSM